MVDVNLIFILSLIIIVIGYVIKKLNIITEENGKIIVKVIFNVTLPAVILKVTSTVELNIALILLPLIVLIFVHLKKNVVQNKNCLHASSWCPICINYYIFFRQYSL